MTSWALRVSSHARGELRCLVALLGLLLLGASLAALVPWPLKLIVDHVLPGVPLPMWKNSDSDPADFRSVPLFSNV